MRQQCERIVEFKYFQNFFTGVILFAALLVGLGTYPEVVANFGRLLEILDLVVIGLFTIEVVIRMGTYGRQISGYFKDPWNQFDFWIVALSLIFLLPLPIGGGFVPVIRLIRILRVLRLLNAFPELQLMVAVLIRSMGYLRWIAVLFLIILYIFGVMGVEFFGDSDPQRFGSLEKSMLTLFAAITSGWSQHLDVLGPASPIVAPIFFLLLVILGLMIMFNLVIGAIMRSVDEETAIRESQQTALLAASRDDLITLLEKQIHDAQETLQALKASREGQVDVE